MARALVGLLFVSLLTACSSSTESSRSTQAQVAAAPTATAQARLPAVSQEALRHSPVRMLLLPAEYAPETTVTTGPHWAALSFHHDALTISLHATDVVHDVLSPEELAHIPPPQSRVRGVPARVTVNEQIRSVSFGEAGVEYALDVECADAFHDTRCTEDAFLLELAEHLEVAR